MWLERTTPDGRWRYGYGEYTKSVAELAGLSEIYQKGLSLLSSVAPSITAYTQVPTYYIWAVDPNGQKRIGGQWNLLTGGAAAMKKRFAIFENAFRPNQSDKGRVDALAATKAAPVLRSAPSGVSRPAMAREVPSAPSYVLPLLIGGAALLFILLRR